MLIKTRIYAAPAVKGLKVQPFQNLTPICAGIDLRCLNGIHALKESHIYNGRRPITKELEGPN